MLITYGVSILQPAGPQAYTADLLPGSVAASGFSTSAFRAVVAAVLSATVALSGQPTSASVTVSISSTNGAYTTSGSVAGIYTSLFASAWSESYSFTGYSSLVGLGSLVYAEFIPVGTVGNNLLTSVDLLAFPSPVALNTVGQPGLVLLSWDVAALGFEYNIVPYSTMAVINRLAQVLSGEYTTVAYSAGAIVSLLAEVVPSSIVLSGSGQYIFSDLIRNLQIANYNLLPYGLEATRNFLILSAGANYSLSGFSIDIGGLVIIVEVFPGVYELFGGNSQVSRQVLSNLASVSLVLSGSPPAAYRFIDLFLSTAEYFWAGTVSDARKTSLLFVAPGSYSSDGIQIFSLRDLLIVPSYAEYISSGGSLLLGKFYEVITEPILLLTSSNDAIGVLNRLALFDSIQYGVSGYNADTSATIFVPVVHSIGRRVEVAGFRRRGAVASVRRTLRIRPS